MDASTPGQPVSEHPATWKFDYPIFHAETREQWRAWLLENHSRAKGVWLCSWRNHTNGPRCPYPEAVEEGICFGWIDSAVMNLDDERGLQLMTPRRLKSPWTRLNRERAAQMEQRGLMTDAGRAVIAQAHASGYWTIADQVEDLIEPPELAAALDDNPASRAAWNAFPPSARKQMLWWIVSAAREDTRASRVAKVVADAAVGARAQG